MRIRCLLVFLTFTSVLILGCIGTVIEEVSIRDAKVRGSMNHPPVFVTMDSTRNPVRISPGFSVNPKHRLTGTIDSESDGDPAKSGNLQWSLPDYTIGIGADFGLGRSGSLTVGGNYGSVDGYDSWNGYVGIGIHNAGPASGFRLDAGLCLRGFRHDAYTVVVTTSDFEFWGSSSETASYHDRGDDSVIDFYAQMTLNTIIKKSPVNLFVSAGILRQTLLKYRPSTRTDWLIVPVMETSSDATYRIILLSLTPGLSFNLGERYMLLVGGRIVTPLGKDLNPRPVISPFMQLDFVL
jgi:hypothetical protein